jgi:predicted acyltransferase
VSTTLPPAGSTGSPVTAAPVAAGVRAGGSEPGSIVGPDATAPRAARERLLSLDVFRGLTVAGMLLVNNPGSWGAIYDPLEHAAWHGWTPTDLIFPFFLFIVGITTHLSLGARAQRGDDRGALVRQVLRRGALIFLFGLLLSWFPGFQWGTVRDLGADPTMLDRVLYRLEHLRVLGVLQRIGLAYTMAGLVTIFVRSLKAQVVVAASVLFAYWWAMTLLPVPDTGYLGQLVLDQRGATLDAWFDRVVLGKDHMWGGGGGRFDPEGLLSTFPAAATALLGVFAGRWLGSGRPIHERLSGLFTAGAIAMVLGLMWHWSFPINKSLWTSSYVLFTGGMACTVLATCMWLVDVHRVSGWTKPFVIYGVNPMVAFLGSGLMARMIYSILKVEYAGETISLQAAIYRSAFLSWLAPVNASLAFAISFVALWLGILWVLWRRGIVLKV